MRKYRYNQTAVLIPDIHQDIEWVDKIITKHKKDNPLFVLMGDLFDARKDNVATAGETARYIVNLKKQLNERLVILVGNHDQAYYARYLGSINPMLYNWDFNLKSLEEISKHIDESFIRSNQLCVYIHGYLISHAGVIGKHFYNEYTDKILDKEESLNKFFKYCDNEFNIFPHLSKLLYPGSQRGGPGLPGLTWCDFDYEFVDELIVPQIFGHTSSKEFPHRIKDKSHCIDGKQTIYGILDKRNFTIHEPLK